jgi:hypothetical protein
MITEFRWDRFKKSGNNVNIAAKGDVFVLTDEQRHVLMDYKRNETLARQAAPPAAQLNDAGDAPWANSPTTTPATYDENTPATPNDTKNSLG